MYAIIYWRKEDEVFPVLTEDGQIKVFDRLTEADTEANKVEKTYGTEARVISCEGVRE